jgi:small subunit ribosomal protein S6
VNPLRVYETIFVVDAHLTGEQIEASVSKFLKILEKNKVQIKSVDRWGKRRLAYEIKRRQYGFYVHIVFSSDEPFVRTLEREYKLDETILRFLTVLVPKDAPLRPVIEGAGSEKPTDVSAPSDVPSSPEPATPKAPTEPEQAG